MKIFALLITTAVLIITSGCNDKKAKNQGTGSEVKLISGDTLMTGIMDAHDVGMAKMGKLSAMQNRVQTILDSIERLPARAKQALVPYKAKMNLVLEDLKRAKSGMEKWMDEFNMDSLTNNAKERIKYLTDEKLKVSKVKESILSSLQKADSLVKEKL